MPLTVREHDDSHRVLIIFLRIIGIFTCTAIIASVMPTAWISATHQWLGLGDFPVTPITQYLARSISALYALFGALMVLVSVDVRRFAPIIRFLGYACFPFGTLLVWIDATSGLPKGWVLFEGPVTIVLGVVILLLVRRVKV